MVRPREERSFPVRARTSCATSSGMPFSIPSSRNCSMPRAWRLPPSTSRSAILSALQLPSLREGVLAETGGVLHRASRLSRLAEQLGWAIRQSGPSAGEADCLRNAGNIFFYRGPHTLPTIAPATALSSEPHSLSRVFTGAFFEGLAGMLALKDTKNEAALLEVSQDIAVILVDGIRGASVVPTFFSQVAATMLGVAATQFSAQGYEVPLRSGF